MHSADHASVSTASDARSGRLAAASVLGSFMRVANTDERERLQEMSEMADPEEAGPATEQHPRQQRRRRCAVVTAFGAPLILLTTVLMVRDRTRQQSSNGATLFALADEPADDVVRQQASSFIPLELWQDVLLLPLDETWLAEHGGALYVPPASVQVAGARQQMVKELHMAISPMAGGEEGREGREHISFNR